MANENPKDLYDQVYNNIYPQINGRGRLYKTIQIIVGEEQLHEQEKTKEICDYFGIKPSANKDEDKEIINDLLDGILRNAPINNVKEIINDLLDGILRNAPINNVIANMAKVINQGVNMEWIFVAAAFTFVGLFLYKQTIDKKEQGKIKPAVQEIKEQPIFLHPIPAGLCLIVPASIVCNFLNSSNLTVEEVKYLIDNASYFLCTTVEVANSNEKNLEITDENISPDSIRDVYIRININDGRNMIDKKIPYYLKTNLPLQSQCTVKKLACLENLSGLEKFNRI